jgi:hypothetical protein
MIRLVTVGLAAQLPPDIGVVLGGDYRSGQEEQAAAQD